MGFQWTLGLSLGLTGLVLEMTQPSCFEKEAKNCAGASPLQLLDKSRQSVLFNLRTDCRFSCLK
jgi:hypothetical protein